MPVNRKKKMCHELKGASEYFCCSRRKRAMDQRTNERNAGSALLAVIALGDARVGKTSLLRELTASNSNNHSNATGLDFRVRLAEVGDALVKIQLWDTADQEKYGASALPAAYFRHARAALLVFDVTDRGSFVNVARWAKQLQSFHDGREFSVVLVANRCEVSSYERVVSASHALRLARALGANYVECNTRDGTNTEQAFELLTDAMANAQVWRPSIDAIDACVADAASPPLVKTKPIVVVETEWSVPVPMEAPQDHYVRMVSPARLMAMKASRATPRRRSLSLPAAPASVSGRRSSQLYTSLLMERGDTPQAALTKPPTRQLHRVAFAGSFLLLCACPALLLTYESLAGAANDLLTQWMGPFGAVASLMFSVLAE
ncbi:hypothetical protein PINS_up012859 [Pythium insidiosum]|nr:hypothetical protein PINS_up012859 [Pythium insidiosum]